MKQIKKSLLLSALALILSISMLVGTTFAWFTDSVTSIGNKIQSGSLKVDLELLDKETGEWHSLKKSQAPIFNYDKWEPGYIDTKVLKVENEGNLALKWVAKFYSEKQLSILADVIDVYVRPSDSEIGYPTDRSLEGYTCVGSLSTFINSIEETTNGTLEAKEAAYLGIALKMRDEAGNDYQNLSLGGAFDIRIFATQHTSESDSFDNQYDKNSLFDDFVDKSILTSQGKYLNDGADSVNFSIYHKGVRIVAASVPASAIANKDKPVTVTIRAIDSYIASGENTQSFAYDIDVTNLKSKLKGDQLVTVVIAAPKGLASIKAYHKNELLTDAVYDEVEGTITFKTASFSPFAVAADFDEVDTLEELRDAVGNDNANIVLTGPIEIKLGKDSTDRSEDHKTTSGYYNAVNIGNKNVSIDLNGKGITVSCGQGHNDNDDVGALFYVGANGSLNIRDNSENKTGYIKMESSIYAVWAPHAEPSYAKIFSGIFIADSYAGDLVGTSTDPGSFDGTMANENSNRALIYAGFGGNINVYGGYFLYNNTPNDIKNRNNGAFNAKDFYNGATPLITIHEGVMLIDKAYRQDPTYTSTPNGDFDNFSIKLEAEDEGFYRISEVTLEEPVEILDKPYATWYKVSRAFKYKVTFMDNASNALDTQYVMDNTNAISVATDSEFQKKAYETLVEKDSSYSGTKFGGWVNAASEKVGSIDAGNTKDIVLYPKHATQYIVRWLDEDGTVIHSVTTTSGTRYDKLTAPSNPASQYDNMAFDHWEVREVDTNGNVTYTDLSDNKNYEITKDITIYPFYNYDGKIGLTPHDTDGDGRPNYYTVESATGLADVIEIPGDVNGVPVTVITDLSSEWNNSKITSVIIKEGVEEIGANAFAMTSNLERVEIPASIEKIGANAFANTIGGSLISKTITIKFAGTWEEFQVACEEDWERGLATGTTVECSDGTATLKATEYWLYYKYDWTFVKK